MAAPSPIRSALNKRLGIDDPEAPDAQTAYTPPPPEQPANTFTPQPVAKVADSPPRPGSGMQTITGDQNQPDPTAALNAQVQQMLPELSGWDSVKSGNLDRAWTDFVNMKYGSTSRAGFANMPSGGLQQAVNDFNYSTGSNARLVPGPSGDLIDFGDGRGPVDVVTAQGQLWNARLGGNNGAPGAGGAPGGGGVAGGAYGLSAGGGVSAYEQQVRDLIMQQLGQLSQPVTANDPSIKGEMDAQGLLAERNRQDRRAAAAERAAANGLLNGGQGSGSFEGDVAAGYEDKGQQLAGIQAQLFGRELQSRRDKVAQLLQMAMQSGDAESARALQLQMAQMDDQIKRLGLAQNQSQFNDQFGLAAGQFQYQKDRDLATYDPTR